MYLHIRYLHVWLLTLVKVHVYIDQVWMVVKMMKIVIDSTTKHKLGLPPLLHLLMVNMYIVNSRCTFKCVNDMWCYLCLPGTWHSE